MDEPLIFSQPSKTKWETDNRALYFDGIVKFSYLSGGERLYFKKMHEDPALITTVKWKKDGEAIHTPLILSTTHYGCKWGVTKNGEDDFVYEDHTAFTTKKHGNYTWYVSLIPYSIDHKIDRNDNYKAIPLFTFEVYDDFEQIVKDILDSADVKPRTVYSGMMGAKGIAFFAGATDLEHIEDAPFIVDCDGRVINNVGGNRVCP